MAKHKKPSVDEIVSTIETQLLGLERAASGELVGLAAHRLPREWALALAAVERGLAACRRCRNAQSVDDAVAAAVEAKDAVYAARELVEYPTRAKVQDRLQAQQETRLRLKGQAARAANEKAKKVQAQHVRWARAYDNLKPRPSSVA